MPCKVSEFNPQKHRGRFNNRLQDVLFKKKMDKKKKKCSKQPRIYLQWIDDTQTGGKKQTPRYSGYLGKQGLKDTLGIVGDGLWHCTLLEVSFISLTPHSK